MRKRRIQITNKLEKAFANAKAFSNLKNRGLFPGTYQFSAKPGNWDGVVPKTVTLNDSQVGRDGYLVVTLTYWRK